MHAKNKQIGGKSGLLYEANRLPSRQIVGEEGLNEGWLRDKLWVRKD